MDKKHIYVIAPSFIDSVYMDEINDIILQLIEECQKNNCCLTVDFNSKLSGKKQTISRKCRQKFVKLTLLDIVNSSLFIYEICLT
jgi:hypothetical protein